jgi:hypothetical protein
MEVVDSLPCHLSSILMLYLETVTAKLYKQDSSGDLQERQRSISYAVVVTTTAHPHVVQTQADAGGEVTTPIHARIIHPPTIMGSDGAPNTMWSTLADVDQSIVDMRMVYKNLKLTPWEPLLSKVERFNKLMSQIAEVSMLHESHLSVFIHLLAS